MAGVCTGPSEVALLLIGRRGPTVNVYIASDVPACPAFDCWPARWQTGSRKQEQEASTWHSKSRHRQTGRTDGQMGGWKCALCLCRLLQRRDADKKYKTERQKDPYMYQNLEAIFKPCSSSSKRQTIKKVMIRHINASVVKQDGTLFFCLFFYLWREGGVCSFFTQIHTHTKQWRHHDLKRFLLKR